jgi:polar amino acid transport system substrate-binding protein
VAVLQNVYAEELVHQALPKAKVDQYDSVDLMYQAVNSGRADAAATDQSSVKYLMVQNPGRYRSPAYAWSPQTYACAVKRGDQDWLNFVNTALHEAMTGVEFPPTRRRSSSGSVSICRRRPSVSPSNSNDPVRTGRDAAPLRYC